MQLIKSPLQELTEHKLPAWSDLCTCILSVSTEQHAVMKLRSIVT